MERVTRREDTRRGARGQERVRRTPEGQAGEVQMEPLHLAMMRALWIWRTHEMRLMASCNQVARTC